MLLILIFVFVFVGVVFLADHLSGQYTENLVAPFALFSLAFLLSFSVNRINFKDVPVEEISIVTAVTDSVDGREIETSSGHSVELDNTIEIQLGDIVRFNRFEESSFWGAIFDRERQSPEFLEVVAQ